MTRIFGGVATAIYSYVIPVANLRLLEGESNLSGSTLKQYSTECLDSLELTTVVRLIPVFVVDTFVNFIIGSRRNISRSTCIKHLECTVWEGFIQKCCRDTPASNLN